MGRKAPEKSAVAVSRLREPGMHAVGGVDGLHLQVLPTGGRSWILRVTIAGKRREMGLGGYPDVPLTSARDKARQAKDKVKDGVDPIEEAKQRQSALKASRASAVTFQDCAERYIKANESVWKNAKSSQQWTNTLTQYAYPHIGDLLVRDIELPNVLQVLEPIWNTKTETASRLRGRIEAVLDWARVHGYRSGHNPAEWKGTLDKVLPAPQKVNKTRHQPALPIDETAAFMKRVNTVEGLGARALEFAILTASRSEMVRGARWPELNLENGVWTVPAERMKTKKQHRVPLSKQALESLKKLPRMADTDLVFPSSRRTPLSDATLGAVIKRLNETDDERWFDPTDGRAIVPHGFRSTFRDWVSEKTNYPNEMAELALAHAVGDKVEAAYRRGDMFERRRAMMQDWADFCENKQRKSVVVALWPDQVA